MLKVFVYGTLKPGEDNYQEYCALKVVDAQKAFALGKLYDLPMGYPAMTMGDDQVLGFLLSFADSSILAALDELEDYHPSQPISSNLYNRKYIQIYESRELPLDWAWAYFMTQDQIHHFEGIYLANGCWSGQRRITN